MSYGTSIPCDDYIEDYKMISNWPREMVRKYADQIDWDYIIETASVGEDFIIEFKDMLNFKLISQYQELSLEFIEKYSGLLDDALVLKHQNSLAKPSELREKLELIAKI